MAAISVIVGWRAELAGPVVVEQDVTGFIAEGLQDLKDVYFIHHDQVLGESADLGLKTT